MSAPLLEIRHLHHAYPGYPVLHDVSFSIQPGELHALLGPSGSGKTTLLRSIAGFEHPNQGSISLHSKVLCDSHHFVPPQKRGLGMVFQAYHLFPHMTIRENILYGLPQKFPYREERLHEVLELVELSEAEKSYPHMLSGGEQQRAALARALAPQPSLLLLDEPFSNLDEKLRVELRAKLKIILHKAHITALLVTHNQDEAMSMADRVSVISAGRILQTATPRTLYLRPATREVASFVGTSTFLPGDARGRIAHTVLGEIAIDQPMEGAVEILLRPECLAPQCLKESAGRAEEISATVVASHFFGKEQLLTLEGPQSQILLARVGVEWPGKVGDRVGLTIRGVLRAFSSHPH